MKKIVLILLMVSAVLALGTCGSVNSNNGTKCVLDDSNIDDCNI